MKVTGFTIARNVVKFDYPIKEAIESILPICDQFLILVGDSEDDTLAYLQSFNNPKIIIKESVWNETLQDGGKVLAVETDKAFQMIDADTNWCFYIQADEVVHEKYLPVIKAGMQNNVSNKKIDGLLFKYLHFYHSYNYIAKSSRFYKHEIRIVRNDKSIFSYIDAQGFRKGDNQKLNVAKLNAFIYHYGWVRPPVHMKAKQESIMKYYHNQEHIDEVIGEEDAFDYTQFNFYIESFNGTHPALMQNRVNAMDWPFDPNQYRKELLPKEKFKKAMRKYLGINLEYANYKLV